MIRTMPLLHPRPMRLMWTGFILLMLSLQINIDIFIVHRQVNYSGPGGISISPPFMIALVILITLLLEPSKKNYTSINNFSSTTIPALLIILAGILSMLNTSDKLISFSCIFQHIKSFVVYFVVANMIKSRRDIRLTVKVLIVCLLTQSLLYYLSYILAGGLYKAKDAHSLVRLGGSFGDKPSMMAAYFSSMLFII